LPAIAYNGDRVTSGRSRARKLAVAILHGMRALRSAAAGGQIGLGIVVETANQPEMR
jgi:hypothetical protein